MNKSILVMDTPENCIKCPLITPISTFTMQGYSCSRNDKKIEHISERPVWCPLLDLPLKKFDIGDSEGLYPKDYRYGWNECIDEILKGGNGNE